MRRFLASVAASPRRKLPVVVGAGALARFEDDLAASAAGRLVIVVSDSNVAPLHGRPLVARLRGRGLTPPTSPNRWCTWWKGKV